MSMILTNRMIRGRNMELECTMRWFNWLLIVMLTVNVNCVRGAGTMENATMRPATAKNTSCKLANITDLQSMKSSCDSDIIYLFFKDSHFDTFPHVFDNFPSLQSVDLSSAGVKHIETTTFNAATHLMTLDMSGSNMQKLAENLFTKANNLSSFDMSNSSIEIVERYAFNGLSNLKRLDLSNNNIVALDSVLFTPLSSLQSIRLTNNKIEVINQDLFLHNSQLEVVYLSSNDIIIVEPTSFIHTHLKWLDLGLNQLRDLDMTTMKYLKKLIVTGNQLDILKVPSVTGEIHAENNSITVIYSEENNELERLFLSSNHFTNLTNLTNFKKLQFLDLSSNHLQNFRFADLKALSKLKELKLCGNKMFEITAEDVVANLPNLKLIELSTKHWSDSYIEELKNDLKNHSIELGQERSYIPDSDSPVVPTIRPAPVPSQTTIKPALTPQSPNSGEIEQQLTEIRKQIKDLEYRMGANAASDSKKIDGRLAGVEDKLTKSDANNDAKFEAIEAMRSSFKVYEVLVIMLVVSATVFVLYKLVLHSRQMLIGMHYRRTQSIDPIFNEQDL